MQEVKNHSERRNFKRDKLKNTLINKNILQENFTIFINLNLPAFLKKNF